MKIRDCFGDIPLTGECPVDVNKLRRCFGKSTIILNNRKYRFVNHRLGMKVTLVPSEATYLIYILNLQGYQDPIFKAIIYRKSWNTSNESL
jgi:hypothetical protein